MKVKLAETAGFCAGVKRAMDLVLRSAQENVPGRLFTWGPLIHNPQVVDFLASRRIFVAEDFEDLSPGDAVVTRSHGIPPEVRDRLKEMELSVCDATCPKVARVQAIVRKHARDGYRVLIFGDEGHAEVNALLAFAEGAGEVIASEDELENAVGDGKVCLVAQTTKNPDQFEAISERLRNLPNDSIIIDTICDATYNRQREILRIAKDVDALVVVGGRNSGNTRRLFELAEETGKPAFWVETADELVPEDFEGLDTVGVTAGASTPHWITSRVVEKLELMGEGFSLRKIPYIKTIAYGFVQANFYAAGAGAMLLILAARLLGLPNIMPLHALVCFLFIFAIYTIRSSVDWQGLVLMDPSKIHFFESIRRFMLPAAFISLLCSLVLSAYIDIGLLLVLIFLAVGATGYLYGKRYILRGKSPFPVSRDVAETVLWTGITVIPVLFTRSGFDTVSLLVLLIVLFLSLVRTILNSLKDVESDRILMRDSIVLLLGERLSRTAGMFLLAVTAGLTGWLCLVRNLYSPLFLVIPLLMFFFHILHLSRMIKSSTIHEISIDFPFYVMGLFAVIGLI